MNIDEFLNKIQAFRRGGGSGKPAGPGDDRGPGDSEEDLSEALNAASEELHTAETELRRQNEALNASRWALEEERRFYHNLFEFAPDGYLVTDRRGVIRDVNLAAVEMFNREKRFLIGKPMAILAVEETRPSFRSSLAKLAHFDQSTKLDVLLVRQGQLPFSAEMSVIAERDREGRDVTLRWTIRDVTARKLLEEQLLELNQALDRRVRERTRELDTELQARERLLIEAHAAADQPSGSGQGQRLIELVQEIDAIIWRSDATDNRFTFVSQGAVTILGYPVARWLDEPDFWMNHLHPDDREMAVKDRRRHLENGTDFEAEYRMVAADGRPVWFRVGVRIHRDDAGRPDELRGVMINITKRKRIERQFYAERGELSARLQDMSYLQELSGRLSATLELQPILEEVVAGVMAVQGAEKAGLKLLDRDRNEICMAVNVGLPPSAAELMNRVPVAPGKGSCSRVVMEKAPLVIEDVLTDAADDFDREVARLAGTRASYSTPLLDRKGDILGTIATYFDGPHRPPERQTRLVELFARQARDFIENARIHREVREAARNRELYMAVLAHEIRNPLNAILTAVQFLKLSPPGDEDSAEAVDAIEGQARHLARMVEDLLEVSRIAQGKVQIRKRPVDLAALVSRAVETARPAIESRSHELIVSLPDAPPRLEADESRLVQVLVNVLTNAAKYTNPGGRIVLSVTRDDGHVVLRVRDNGIGIAPDVLPNIFDLFTQAEHASEHAQGGMGIGLWLVRNLVELHGGCVTASSLGIGHGTEFVITLPSQSTPPQKTTTEPLKRRSRE